LVENCDIQMDGGYRERRRHHHVEAGLTGRPSATRTSPSTRTTSRLSPRSRRPTDGRRVDADSDDYRIRVENVTISGSAANTAAVRLLEREGCLHRQHLHRPDRLPPATASSVPASATRRASNSLISVTGGRSCSTTPPSPARGAPDEPSWCRTRPPAAEAVSENSRLFCRRFLPREVAQVRAALLDGLVVGASRSVLSASNSGWRAGVSSTMGRGLAVHPVAARNTERREYRRGDVRRDGRLRAMRSRRRRRRWPATIPSRLWFQGSNGSSSNTSPSRGDVERVPRRSWGR